jgi:hypothetical protein
MQCVGGKPNSWYDRKEQLTILVFILNTRLNKNFVNETVEIEVPCYQNFCDVKIVIGLNYDLNQSLKEWVVIKT